MKGSCSCGCISFETNEIVDSVNACHCNICNKTNGSPNLIVNLKAKEVMTTGEENISYYASSENGERAFCKKCGTRLFFKYHKADVYQFSVGLFDLKDLKPVSVEIFTDQKPNYYGFLNNESVKMTKNDFIQYMNNLAK